MIRDLARIVLRRTYLYDLWVVAPNHARLARNLEDWERAGKPPPTPHLAKQLAVKQYARDHGCGLLIETGTFCGDMIEATYRHFRNVISIELSAELHDRARRRFMACRNVEIILGDSGRVLPVILQTVDEPCVLWLDAHCSADITARGDEETPILRELSSITKHVLFDKHVVLIDDARCFTGQNDYPSIDEVRAMARAASPDCAFVVKDDIIRIHPPGRIEAAG